LDEDESRKRDIQLICGDVSIDEPEVQQAFAAVTFARYPKRCLRPMMELLRRAEKNCKREVENPTFGENPTFLFKLLLKSPECRKDLQKGREEVFMFNVPRGFVRRYNNDFCNVGSDPTATSEALKGVAMERAVKQAMALRLDSPFDHDMVFKSRRRWMGWFTEPIRKYLAGESLDIQVQDDTEKCVQTVRKQNPLCPFENSLEVYLGAEYWRQVPRTFACRPMVARIENELRSETEELKRFKEKLCSLETDENIDETCKLQSLPCTFLSFGESQTRILYDQKRISYLERLRLERKDFCYENLRSDVRRFRDDYLYSYTFRAIVKGFEGGVQSLFGP
jgi:hypothetical protein